MQPRLSACIERPSSMSDRRAGAVTGPVVGDWNVTLPSAETASLAVLFRDAEPLPQERTTARCWTRIPVQMPNRRPRRGSLARGSAAARVASWRHTVCKPVHRYGRS